MKIFELFGEISLPGIDKVNTQLQGLEGKVKKLAPTLKKIGTGMTVAGGAILAGFGVSVKAAADFETAMREVNTMMGLSQEEFIAFSSEVQALASDLGVDAVDSANALYQAISAGVPKENAIEFLAIATKAAIGGVTDTATAVDGLSTVINAFKLPLSDTQKVADLMFTTVKGGKTTFEELSASLFQVAPIAAASGVRFEEVSAALATMTKQGVPTAQATTQLRQAMVALQKPTKEMNEVIAGLGYESGQAMLADLGLAETLNKLRDSTGGSNEQLMKMFGSVEAGSAVLALTGDNATMFAGDLEAMAGATGAATDAFEEMEKSASRQMEALKNSFKDVQISIGNVLLPILKDIVDKIKPIIESIKNWISENPGLTKTIVIIVGAVAGLLVTLGPLLIMLPGIISLLPILGGAFAALMGPIGIAIAAIAAIIAIGVLVWKNWDVIKEKAVAIWNGIVGFFKGVWGKITGLFKENWDKILAILFPAVGIPILIARNWDKVKEVTVAIWTNITNWIEGKWNAMIDFFKGIPAKIGEAFSTVKDIILSPFRAAWSGIEAGINWLIRMLNSISFTVPDWVPGVGGKGFGINIPEVTLPKFGRGGLIPEPTVLSSIRTGAPYAIAGESGAEKVVPMGVSGNTGVSIRIDHMIVRNDRDIDLIADQLVNRMRLRGVKV